MNLVFIYGPPAVGKLTVAEELAKMTGYSIFHNHLVQDLVDHIYPAIDVQRFDLADQMYSDVFEHAARNGTSIIFTFVYDHDEQDQELVKRAVKLFGDNNGKVLFVQLFAPGSVLLERVTNDSRKKFQKIKDRNKLAGVLEGRDLGLSVDADDILRIDTSKQDASTSAQQIVDYFSL